jgi:nicotinate-nucleotide adenylyltransferase
MERVVLVPSANPPHKQDRAITPARDRLTMCRLAVADDPHFEVSDCELNRDGPSYTLLTIRHFRQIHGADATLYWLIGMDSLHELKTWHRAAELVEACTLVTAARPGSEAPTLSDLTQSFSPAQAEKLLAHIVGTRRIDIAGTDVRERVRAGRAVRYLVPDPVIDFIASHELYR